MKINTLKKIITIYAVVSVLGATSLIFLTKRDSLLSETYNVAVDKMVKQGKGEVSYDTGYLASLIIRIDNHESLVVLLLVLQLVTASLLLFIIINTDTTEKKPNDVS